MSAGVIILGMALINLVLRCPLFLVANRIRIPGIVEKALAHCPVAVLTAIIVPFALHLDQAPDGSEWLNPDLFATGAAIAASLVTRNLMATIAIGSAWASPSCCATWRSSDRGSGRSTPPLWDCGTFSVDLRHHHGRAQVRQKSNFTIKNNELLDRWAPYRIACRIVSPSVFPLRCDSCHLSVVDSDGTSTILDLLHHCSPIDVSRICQGDGLLADRSEGHGPKPGAS